MSEAVEFRVKKGRVQQKMLFSLLVMVIGLTLAVFNDHGGAETALKANIGAMALAIYGLFLGTRVAGHLEENIWRRFHERAGYNYADPPLREWEHRLEEEGAFMDGDSA